MGEANGNSKKRSYYKKMLIINSKAIPVTPFFAIAFSGLSLVGEKILNNKTERLRFFRNRIKYSDGFKTRLKLIRGQRLVRMWNI